MASSQWPSGVATRTDLGRPEFNATGTVSGSVDQKEKWPRRPALDKPGIGATWPKDLVGGVLEPAEHPFREKEGADVIRVPVPVTDTQHPAVGSAVMPTAGPSTGRSRCPQAPRFTPLLRGPG